MLLVLVAGLLGLSAQIYATTGCTSVDGGPLHCTQFPNPGPWPSEPDISVGPDVPDFDPYGNGGGGGTLGSVVRIGTILISVDDWIKVAEAAGHLGELTVEWGKKDIDRFRETGGLHVVNPQFSLIPWQDAQVNWNLYGANDSSLSTDQIWSNFVDAMNARMGG